MMERLLVTTQWYSGLADGRRRRQRWNFVWDCPSVGV